MKSNKSVHGQLTHAGMNRSRKKGKHLGRPIKYIDMTPDGYLTPRLDIVKAGREYWYFRQLYGHRKRSLIQVIFPDDIAEQISTRDALRLSVNVYRRIPDTYNHVPRIAHHAKCLAGRASLKPPPRFQG